MSVCPMFYLHTETHRSNEVRLYFNSGKSVRVEVPCCDHKHSPAARHIAPKVVGGDKLLKCGGDLAKCQIPTERR